MKQAKALMTFEVRIEQCRNSTWQGKLTADGHTVEFRSGLELLLEMDRLLCPAAGNRLGQEKASACGQGKEKGRERI